MSFIELADRTVIKHCLQQNILPPAELVHRILQGPHRWAQARDTTLTPTTLLQYIQHDHLYSDHTPTWIGRVIGFGTPRTYEGRHVYRAQLQPVDVRSRHAPKSTAYRFNIFDLPLRTGDEVLVHDARIIMVCP